MFGTIFKEFAEFVPTKICILRAKIKLPALILPKSTGKIVLSLGEFLVNSNKNYKCARKYKVKNLPTDVISSLLMAKHFRP